MHLTYVGHAAGSYLARGTHADVCHWLHNKVVHDEMRLQGVRLRLAHDAQTLNARTWYSHITVHTLIRGRSFLKLHIRLSCLTNFVFEVSCVR